MKKSISSLLVLTFCFALSSCNDDAKQDVKFEEEVKVIVPYGTPHLAIGGLINTDNLSIDSVNGAANLQAAFAGNDYDIVIAPINLGAKLYTAGKSNYKVAAVLTMNNAYMVAKDNAKLDAISDVVGQNVLAFGETGIPGSLLKSIFAANNISLDSVDFTAASSTACYSVFTNSETKYALLSEPEISKLKINDHISLETIDLCSLIDGNVPQACIFVKDSANKDTIDDFLRLVKNNVADTNDANSYVEKVLPLDRVFEQTGAAVLKASLPFSGITYKNAKDEAQADIQSVLSLLGVTSPSDDFYY